MDVKDPYQFLENLLVKSKKEGDEFLQALAFYKLVLLEQLAVVDDHLQVRFIQGRIYEINQILGRFGKK